MNLRHNEFPVNFTSVEINMEEHFSTKPAKVLISIQKHNKYTSLVKNDRIPKLETGVKVAYIHDWDYLWDPFPNYEWITYLPWNETYFTVNSLSSQSLEIISSPSSIPLINNGTILPLTTKTIDLSLFGEFPVIRLCFTVESPNKEKDLKSDMILFKISTPNNADDYVRIFSLSSNSIGPQNKTNCYEPHNY